MKTIPDYHILFVNMTLWTFYMFEVVTAKEMIDYFLPIPNDAQLTSNTWGASVTPRDITNGLESRDNQWHYWDGKVIRDDAGVYHLHCSRWPKSSGFSSWSSSKAIHATSDNLLGPYEDHGACYDHANPGFLFGTAAPGGGHNVATLAMPDGNFALYTADVYPASIYVAPSLEGPWTYKGDMKVDGNGFDPRRPEANVTIVVRPDNTFLATHRYGFIFEGGEDIMGTFITRTHSVWPHVPGLENEKAEDPVIWYSGGYYHITVNWWDTRIAHHLMSKDGINDWQDMGVAYDPQSDFIRYKDGSVNHWHNIERPNVIMDDGHVIAFTFAATDTEKNNIKAGDNSGSKIIVVPFDGVAFDREICGDTTGITSENTQKKRPDGYFRIQSVRTYGNSIRVTFSIPVPEQVRITLFNLSGRKQRIPVDRHFDAGIHSLLLETSSFNQGCYVVHFNAGKTICNKYFKILH